MCNDPPRSSNNTYYALKLSNLRLILYFYVQRSEDGSSRNTSPERRPTGHAKVGNSAVGSSRHGRSKSESRRRKSTASEIVTAPPQAGAPPNTGTSTAATYGSTHAPTAAHPRAQHVDQGRYGSVAGAATASTPRPAGPVNETQHSAWLKLLDGAAVLQRTIASQDVARHKSVVELEVQAVQSRCADADVQQYISDVRALLQPPIATLTFDHDDAKADEAEAIASVIDELIQIESGIQGAAVQRKELEEYLACKFKCTWQCNTILKIYTSITSSTDLPGVLQLEYLSE